MAGKPLWKFVWDLTPWRRFKTQVVQDLKGGGRGPIGTAIREDWPRIYFEFLRRKFRENSSGAGEWPPLSPRTLEKNEKRRGILRITDTLYNALIPGSAGNIIKKLPTGVRVGVGGDRKHPGTKGRLTIGQLVNLHQQGGGRLPQRRIIIPPPPEILERMKRSAQRRFREWSNTMPKPKGGGTTRK